MNVRAFQSASLCPADMDIAPFALSLLTMYCRIGAGQIPKSSMSHPDASKAEVAADWSIGPEILVSLPNRTFREFIKVPKALAKFMTSSGVIVSPTIPLIPDMPILRSFIGVTFLLSINYIKVFHDREEK